LATLKPAEQRRVERGRAPVAVERHAGAVRARLDRDRAQPAIDRVGGEPARGLAARVDRDRVGVDREADPLDARRHRGEHRRRPRVVEVDDGRAQSRLPEERGLRRGVGPHGAVVVQVVARQVRERGDRHARARQPVLVQPDRRGLDRDRVHALRREAREERLQRQRVRRGQAGVRERARAARADRADHRAVAPQRLQALGDPLAAAGLAVGAGDREHVEPGRRRVVVRVGDRAGERLQAGHRAHRHGRGAGCRRPARDGGRPASSASTTSAAAPRPSACATKRRPSARSPGYAKNASPFATARLSATSAAPEGSTVFSQRATSAASPSTVTGSP
jgi:hypothetical protein